jgi:hypothetical protein
VQAHDLGRTLRRLEPSGWVAAARRFSASLRSAGHEPGRLLVVGSQDAEPWHLTAHLAQAAAFEGRPELTPQLVRWHVPAGARPHLAVGIDVLHRSARGATVLVATPSDADAGLLERLDDARRGGATLFAMHPGEGPLDELAHLSLALPDPLVLPGDAGFETAVHVLGAADPVPGQRRRLRLPSVRRGT